MKKNFWTFTHYMREVAWSDWRGRLVILTVLIASAITFIIWWRYPDASNVTTFFGAAFASWVSGFILFIITGFVIALVTLLRPEREIFEARARNLLQRQTGPHINYIISKLHDLFEPYLEEMTRDIAIIDYDVTSKMFLLTQDSVLSYRSYLPDIPVVFDSQVGYVNGNKSPDGKKKASFTFLKVDGKTVGSSEEFDVSIRRDFQISVHPLSTVKVRYRLTYWVLADAEPNRQLVKRFTRKLLVTVHNHLSTETVTVYHPNDEELKWSIPAGEQAQVVNMNELTPTKDANTFAFDFRLSLA
ncbi:hypothetical protein [Mesorhizobium sp. B2-3-15]|uniref:hypothetical protein n=1 Tax=Mesorhizobium sp. B2-3-15 TaxID=2589949 RepID=UPI00117471BE|nr:hypothetical protein [Mesorhizobium sp. B2-3-15]TPL75121.1 hypothetical protein FJ954_09195 [Mesorhizobium sp. B2-3-15]